VATEHILAGAFIAFPDNWKLEEKVDNISSLLKCIQILGSENFDANFDFY